MLLTRNLVLIYSLAGRRLPDLSTDPQGAAALLEAWRVATRDIPAVWLDRVFELAIQAHTSDYLITSGEVRKAWDSTAAEREQGARARALPAPQGMVPCSGCGGGGWLRHDAPVGTPLFGQVYPCGRCGGSGQVPGAPPAPPRPATPADLARLESAVQALAAQHRDYTRRRPAPDSGPPAAPPAREFLRAPDDPAVVAAVAATLDPQAQGQADTARLPGPVRADAP